jgi:hypothetical protein
MRKPKRPTDPNQSANSVVDPATVETAENLAMDSLAAYASAFGRKGQLVGGQHKSGKAFVSAACKDDRRWCGGKVAEKVLTPLSAIYARSISNWLRDVRNLTSKNSKNPT